MSPVDGLAAVRPRYPREEVWRLGERLRYKEKENGISREKAVTLLILARHE